MFFESEDFLNVAKVKVFFSNPLVVDGADFQEAIGFARAVQAFKGAGLEGVDEYVEGHSSFSIGHLKGKSIGFEGTSNTSVWFDYFFPIISKQFDSCICREFGVPNLCLFMPDPRTRIVGWLKKYGMTLPAGSPLLDDGLEQSPEPAKVQKATPKQASEQAFPDGPDPRFKEGELFASKRSFVGFPVSPLFSGGARGIIVSAPDTDSYGGGVRDNDLVNRVKVFSSTLDIQLQKHFPSVTVEYHVRPSVELSFSASIDVSVGEDVYRGCVEVSGVLGSGFYSLSVFSESCGEIRLGELNLKLAVRVVALIQGKFGGRHG